MKNELIYQSTNYDCGPTSVVNAIRFLFEREEIPPVVLKQIWAICLDNCSECGEPGRGGTSKAAMRYMASWFQCFAENCHFPLKTVFLDEESSLIEEGSPVWKCLEKGGCAVVRCWHGKHGHYVLVTQLTEDGMVGLFDPYVGDPDRDDPDRRFICDAPLCKNREVRREILNLTDMVSYAMGEPDRREVLLFCRTDR